MPASFSIPAPAAVRRCGRSGAIVACSVPMARFPAHRSRRSVRVRRAPLPAAADRLNKTQYQYTLADSDPGELNHWAPLFLEKIRALPGITGVTTDQLNAGP